MADSTTFPFSIFRYTSNGDTEANINDSEAIGFQYGISEPDLIGVIGFNIGIPQRRTDVPNVGQRSTEKPATGLIAIPITIPILINEKSQDVPKPLAKLLKFSLENQTVRGVFTKGRFGLRNDNLMGLPTIIPEVESGIKFINFSLDDEINWTTHQTGTIELEFVGDYASFITNLNTIINA